MADIISVWLIHHVFCWGRATSARPPARLSTLDADRNPRCEGFFSLSVLCFQAIFTEDSARGPLNVHGEDKAISSTVNPRPTRRGFTGSHGDRPT
jgi:hypothetical protein